MGGEPEPPKYHPRRIIGVSVAAYYNDIEPFCVDWLKELIRQGLIADGDVDDRSIEEVEPDDLRGYTQHHFFVGIAGWPLALQMAGWPEDRPQ